MISTQPMFFFFLFRFKDKSQLDRTLPNKNASKRKECWAWWIKRNQTQLCFPKADAREVSRSHVDTGQNL